jgi:hypothetical protein
LRREAQVEHTARSLRDHSSLTKIRERYSLNIFRNLFERIVEMCVEAGLVRGEELLFDATKVEADAAVTGRSRGVLPECGAR